MWQPEPLAEPRQPGVTLGKAIAAYRRGRRQSHKDSPWSQEELAFASGTDQAHISRIESNRQIPEYSTLVRICDALGLSQPARAGMLALAGYQIAPPLPDGQAVASVLDRLAPLIDSYPYPAVLLDEGERLWYLNRMVATVWGACYGATDREGCLERVRGRRVVELIFDPEPCASRMDVWRTYYADVEQVLARILTIFRRACAVRPHDAEMARIVAHLSVNDDFLRRWRRLDQDSSDLALVDHHAYLVTHPRLGPLRLHAWRTRVAQDERLIIVHFTPTDSRTSRVLARLTEADSRQVAGMSVRH